MNSTPETKTDRIGPLETPMEFTRSEKCKAYTNICNGLQLGLGSRFIGNPRAFGIEHISNTYLGARDIDGGISGTILRIPSNHPISALFPFLHECNKYPSARALEERPLGCLVPKEYNIQVQVSDNPRLGKLL